MITAKRLPHSSSFQHIEIEIYFQNWILLDHGEGHLVFQNIHSQDPLFSKVFIISQHQQHQNHTFTQIYQQILTNQTQLIKFFNQRQTYHIDQINSKVFLTFINQQLTIENKIAFIQKITLTDNLFLQSDQRWNLAIQFKPKCPLFDIYSLQFLQKIGFKHDLKLQILLKTLAESSQIEKTRWFKKNCLKQKKKNVNPLNIYGFNNIIPDYLSHLKLIKSNISLNNEETLLINQQIHQFLHNSLVFKLILQFQAIYQFPIDFLTHLQGELQQIKKQNFIPNVGSLIEQKIQINFQRDLREIIKESHERGSIFMQNKSKLNLVSLLQFLISLTWRDVSIILRGNLAKINSKISLNDIDIKIIDYDLKDVNKLKQNIKKDELYLVNYLRFKAVIK